MPRCPEQTERNEAICNERLVLVPWGYQKSLSDISKDYGISIERVRQIIKNAKAKHDHLVQKTKYDQPN